MSVRTAPEPLPCHEGAARELLDALADPACRSVMVCAPAAAGKTTMCRWALGQLDGRPVVEWAGCGGAEAGQLPVMDAWFGGGKRDSPPVIFFDDVDISVRSGNKGTGCVLSRRLDSLPAGSKVLLTCTLAPGKATGGVPASLARAVSRRVNMTAPSASDVDRLLRRLFPTAPAGAVASAAAAYDGDVRSAILRVQAGSAGDAASGQSAVMMKPARKKRAAATATTSGIAANISHALIAEFDEAAAMMDAFGLEAYDDLLPRIAGVIRSKLDAVVQGRLSPASRPETPLQM